jgi:hypothetical protein
MACGLGIMQHPFRDWDVQLHWLANVLACGDGGFLREIPGRAVRPLDVTLYIVPPSVFDQVNSEFASIGLTSDDYMMLRHSPTFETSLHEIEVKSRRKILNDDGTIFVVVMEPQALYELPKTWFVSRIIVDEPELVSKVRRIKNRAPPKKLQILLLHGLHDGVVRGALQTHQEQQDVDR